MLCGSLHALKPVLASVVTGQGSLRQARVNQVQVHLRRVPADVGFIQKRLLLVATLPESPGAFGFGVSLPSDAFSQVEQELRETRQTRHQFSEPLLTERDATEITLRRSSLRRNWSDCERRHTDDWTSPQRPGHRSQTLPLPPRNFNRRCNHSRRGHHEHTELVENVG